MNDDSAEIGKLTMQSRDSSFVLRCNSLSYDQEEIQHPLLVASVAGPHTSVKAFRAALSTGNARFKPELPGRRRIRDLCRWPGGYSFHAHRLGCHTWHLVVIAKREGLIPKLNDASLWSELQKPRFTTPLLRDWIPWLREELESRELLTRLEGFQCEAAVLKASTADLDSVLQDRAPLEIAG